MIHVAVVHTICVCYMCTICVKTVKYFRELLININIWIVVCYKCMYTICVCVQYVFFVIYVHMKWMFSVRVYTVYPVCNTCICICKVYMQRVCNFRLSPSPFFLLCNIRVLYDFWRNNQP